MKTRVLFVCTGNICRSPAAQGAFETLVRRAGQVERADFDRFGR